MFEPFEIEMGIPRHAAGPRQVARAAEIWRLFQELALQATCAVGWPPERYLQAGTAFVVYGITGVHLRQVAYAERLRARTWVHDFKRGTLTRRQVRLFDERGPVASGTQQWVHTNASLAPVAAGPELLAAFPCHPGEPCVSLPETVEALSGAWFEFEVRPWFTWMDPLDHVNHPAWVDFCDEGTMRALAAAGIDPQLLVPVAEQLVFKRGALAMEELRVRTRLAGRTQAGDAVLEHEIDGPTGLYGKGTTVRRLADGADLAGRLRS